MERNVSKMILTDLIKRTITEFNDQQRLGLWERGWLLDSILALRMGWLPLSRDCLLAAYQKYNPKSYPHNKSRQKILNTLTVDDLLGALP